MKKFTLTAGVIAILGACGGAALAASDGGYRPGMLGVNTDLSRRSPSPVAPPMPSPATRANPTPPSAPRNVDLRPLPPRPMIERPIPAPPPSPAPRANIQAEPTGGKNQGTVRVDTPVGPKTSVGGSVTGTLNLPPNQGSPTVDDATIGVIRETK